MATRVSFSFNAKNESAQRAAKDYAAKLIRGVSEETRDGIRGLIARSIREGIPPLEAAKLI